MPKTKKSKAEEAKQNEDLLSMDQAIERLKTTRPTFYRWLKAGKIKGVKLGRQWRFHSKDIEALLSGEPAKVDLPVDIKPLIAELQNQIKSRGKKPESSRAKDDVQQVVNLLIQLSIYLSATDIHVGPILKPNDDDTIGSIRCRVDGVLQEIADFDLRLLSAVVEKIKSMAACDVNEKVRPQDGRIILSLKDNDDQSRQIDLRINFLPGLMGEAVTVRILDSKQVTLDIDRIPFTEEDRKKIDEALHSPSGMIICTGPTGSGKTTSMYCMLNELSGPEVKAMSIEEPVEYMLPWVTQIPLRRQDGVDFVTSLRASLRADPDIVMVGEIRDRETLMVCHEVALTGHIVLTSLHTNNAVSALKRMVDIGSDPFIIADSTKLIVAQRLVRRLCPDCSQDKKPPKLTLDLAMRIAQESGLNWDNLPNTFKEPKGCKNCSRGYKGRTVIAEVLPMSFELAEALEKGQGLDELRQIAVEQGMTTLAAAGLQLVAEGVTSLAEIVRTLGIK